MHWEEAGVRLRPLGRMNKYLHVDERQLKVASAVREMFLRAPPDEHETCAAPSHGELSAVVEKAMAALAPELAFVY